ncbi:hypothetical protein Ddc_09496 [Ditylenchus destructor]|nr:hypothetical protein Ddc_09496 [Ditylenchus destructor]
MNAGRLDKLIERFLSKNSADSGQDSLKKAEENDFGKNSTNNSIARNRRFRRPPLRRTPENEPDEASSSSNTDLVNQRNSSEEIDELTDEIDPNFPSTSTTFAQVFPKISNVTDLININQDVNHFSKAGVPDETGNQPGVLTPSNSDRLADNSMTQHAPFAVSNRDFSSNAVTSTIAGVNSSIVSPSAMASGSSTHQDLSVSNRVDSRTIPSTRKFDFGVYNFANREIGQNQPHPRLPNNPVKMELNSPDGNGCKSISSAYAYAAAANFAEFLSSNSGLSSAAAAVAASTNPPYSLMQHPISSINLRWDTDCDLNSRCIKTQKENKAMWVIGKSTGQPALISHGYCIAADWSLVEMWRIDGDPQTVPDSLDN